MILVRYMLDSIIYRLVNLSRKTDVIYLVDKQEKLPRTRHEVLTVIAESTWLLLGKSTLVGDDNEGTGFSSMD